MKTLFDINPTLVGLLGAVEAERIKYQPGNKVLEGLVGHLVDCGFYPTHSKKMIPALKMVENYGVFWHIYLDPLFCPHCGEDLRNLEHGAPYKREIGVSAKDRVQYYECPKCHGRIER